MHTIFLNSYTSYFTMKFTFSSEAKWKHLSILFVTTRYIFFLHLKIMYHHYCKMGFLIEVVPNQIKQFKCSTQELTQGCHLVTNVFIQRF